MPPNSQRPADRIGARVRQWARELGFHAVGIAPAGAVPAEEFERYLQFLADGLQGDMGYLGEHVEVRRRLDGPAILAGARSIVCVALGYVRSNEAEASDPPLARLLARYARGEDYHRVVRRRLGRLAAQVRGLAAGVEVRALCDTAPVLERFWAARAGLGFVGKHGLLVVPGRGSFVVLGEVVTTLDLGEGPDPVAEACGACTRCLEACPTGALVAPFRLDPRRCIAYATIEAAGTPPPAVARALAEHLFGCDRCQEICPHNQGPPPDPRQTLPFRPLERWRGLDLADLVGSTAVRWQELRQGTALGRLSHDRLLRNAVLVAAARAARGDEPSQRLLERCRDHPLEWVRRLGRASLGAGSGSFRS